MSAINRIMVRKKKREPFDGGRKKDPEADTHRCHPLNFSIVLTLQVFSFFMVVKLAKNNLSPMHFGWISIEIVTSNFR